MLLVPQRERGIDETVLPEDYQWIMDVARRADAPVSKLNRLAERGWLRKLADGEFTTTR